MLEHVLYYITATNIYYILTIMMCIIILYYVIQERKYVSHKLHNKYIIDSTEILPSVSYFSYPTNTIQHIYWSGGPNSTALLCYCLIVLGHPVQPIFITNTIIPGNIKNIKRIRKILMDKYPHLQSRLLPTWYVTSIDKNRDITGLFVQMKKQNPNITDIYIQKWDAISRFTASDNKLYFMAGNISESPLFHLSDITILNRLLTKKLSNKLIFPQSQMTHMEIKQLALDSNNYFWDLIN